MSEPSPDPAARPASFGPFLLGATAGAAAFAVLVGAGLLLYQRVYEGSPLALVIIVALFGGFGAYLAWLVGVLVFSSVRPGREGDELG